MEHIILYSKERTGGINCASQYFSRAFRRQIGQAIQLSYSVTLKAGTRIIPGCSGIIAVSNSFVDDSHFRSRFRLSHAMLGNRFNRFDCFLLLLFFLSCYAIQIKKQPLGTYNL